MTEEFAGSEGEETVAPKAPEMDRLPPPAFPPGTRRERAAPRTSGWRGDASAGVGFPAGAFISPDEPIRRIGEEASGPEDDDEVEVTGIGSREPDYYRSVASPTPKPYTPVEIADLLEDLATGLRERGAAAIVADPHLSPFESTLRGFIGGYLVGKGTEGG